MGVEERAFTVLLAVPVTPQAHFVANVTPIGGRCQEALGGRMKTGPALKNLLRDCAQVLKGVAAARADGRPSLGLP